MTGDVFHRLGMGLVIASGALCAATALVALTAIRRRRVARRRRESLLGLGRVRRPRSSRLPEALRTLPRRWAVPAVTGVAVAAVVGGAVGCAAGAVGAYGMHRLRRRSGERAVSAGDQADRRLPVVAELLAACLAAGAAPAGAADAVGRTLDGPLCEALRRAAAEVRLGGDPEQCWARLAALPGAHDLGRWMARASTTGVPPVAAVSRLAADYRAARGRSAGRRARRAAVLATAPLGLCFLPAFLAIGVLPVVIGLAERMSHA